MTRSALVSGLAVILCLAAGIAMSNAEITMDEFRYGPLANALAALIADQPAAVGPTVVVRRCLVMTGRGGCCPVGTAGAAPHVVFGAIATLGIGDWKKIPRVVFVVLRAASALVALFLPDHDRPGCHQRIAGLFLCG